MIRMVYCIMRNENVSVSAFRKYFEEDYRDLGRQVARKLNATRYTQSLTLMIERNFRVMAKRGTEMPYDGIIEMWWVNASDLDSNRQTIAAQKLVEDFFNQPSDYFDIKNSRLFFTEQPKDY